MTNSKSNRVVRLGIPFLFGMLLVVNCGSEGSKGGSGCEMPNIPSQAPPSPKVLGGTVREFRNSVVTRVPTREGYRFDPETAAFAGSSNRAINFVASRLGV